MPYSFTLKDNNQKAYKQFTWFLFFLHIIAAAVVALKATDNMQKVSIYILLGFYLLIFLGYNFYRTHTKALETFSFIMALLYANFWLKHVGAIAVIIFTIVYLLVTVVKGKRTTVTFGEDGIQLTRVFKTVLFPWAAMSNVVLKDNILTIDFKTNKIIQVEIVETAIAVDEYEFNGFCAGQLNINPVSG